MLTQDLKSKRQIQGRRRIDIALYAIFLLCTSIGMIALMTLIIQVIMDGHHYLSSKLFTNFPSRFVTKSGMKSAIVGSVYMVTMMAPLAFMLGVGAAIYLEEYAKKTRLNTLIQLNIGTLAGVPSIVYGMLGLTIFVRTLNFGHSLIAGVLTMTLLVLPIIIISSQEAIKAVPRARRDASFALGATKWQTVFGAVLPSAIPGILTGVILAISRAIGETAPLILVGAATYVSFLPGSLFDSFSAMPLQIYNWISRPQENFRELGASAIIVLLIILFLLNLSAILIRNKYQKKV